jgi:hypothetical protein
VIGYLPAGTAAVRTITNSPGRTSRASVWSPIAHVVPGAVGGLAAVAVVALAIVAALRLRAQTFPSLAAAGALAAYLLVGAYVLPWYPAWVLPSAALTRRSWLSGIVAVHAAFLVAAYELPRRVVSGTATTWLGGAFIAAGEFLLLATFVAVVARASRANLAGRVDASA